MIVMIYFDCRVDYDASEKIQNALLERNQSLQKLADTESKIAELEQRVQDKDNIFLKRREGELQHQKERLAAIQYDLNFGLLSLGDTKTEPGTQ